MSEKVVFITHWMNEHPLEVVCPEIKFETVVTYSDPLRRQICEAVYIAREGSLNRKSEYNSNELCSLSSTESYKDQLQRWQDECESKR